MDLAKTILVPDLYALWTSVVHIKLDTRYTSSKGISSNVTLSDKIRIYFSLKATFKTNLWKMYSYDKNQPINKFISLYALRKQFASIYTAPSPPSHNGDNTRST